MFHRNNLDLTCQFREHIICNSRAANCNCESICHLENKNSHFYFFKNDLKNELQNQSSRSHKIEFHISVLVSLLKKYKCQIKTNYLNNFGLMDTKMPDIVQMLRIIDCFNEIRDLFLPSKQDDEYVDEFDDLKREIDQFLYRKDSSDDIYQNNYCYFENSTYATPIYLFYQNFRSEIVNKFIQEQLFNDCLIEEQPLSPVSKVDKKITPVDLHYREPNYYRLKKSIKIESKNIECEKETKEHKKAKKKKNKKNRNNFDNNSNFDNPENSLNKFDNSVPSFLNKIQKNEVLIKSEVEDSQTDSQKTKIELFNEQWEIFDKINAKMDKEDMNRFKNYVTIDHPDNNKWFVCSDLKKEAFEELQKDIVTTFKAGHILDEKLLFKIPNETYLSSVENKIEKELNGISLDQFNDLKKHQNMHEQTELKKYKDGLKKTEDEFQIKKNDVQYPHEHLVLTQKAIKTQQTTEQNKTIKETFSNHEIATSNPPTMKDTSISVFSFKNSVYYTLKSFREKAERDFLKKLTNTFIEQELNENPELTTKPSKLEFVTQAHQQQLLNELWNTKKSEVVENEVSKKRKKKKKKKINEETKEFNVEILNQKDLKLSENELIKIRERLLEENEGEEGNNFPEICESKFIRNE